MQHLVFPKLRTVCEDMPDKVDLLLRTVQHFEQSSFGTFEAALAAPDEGLREQIAKNTNHKGKSACRR